MKLLQYLLILFVSFSFVACGGGDEQQQAASDQGTETEVSDDIRTIEIVGIDAMKFAVKQNIDGITVSDTVGADNDLLLLETIEAAPGEEIRIRLTTRSTLPASAMAHNWILLNMGVDASAFANAAVQAKANDYVPQDRQDEIFALTGLTAGGQTEEVVFTVPEQAGEYDYICSFPGHFAAGMKGKLVVSE